MNILKKTLSVFLSFSIFFGVALGNVNAYTVNEGIAVVDSIEELKTALDDGDVTSVKLVGGPHVLESHLLMYRNVEIACDLQITEYGNLMLAPGYDLTVNGSIINSGAMQIFPYTSVIIGSGEITNNGTIFLYDKLYDDGTGDSWNFYSNSFDLADESTGNWYSTADVDTTGALDLAMEESKYSEIWLSEFADKEQQALTIDYTGDLEVTKTLVVREGDTLNINGNLLNGFLGSPNEGVSLIIEGDVNVTGSFGNHGEMIVTGNLRFDGSGQNSGQYTLYSSGSITGTSGDLNDLPGGTHKNSFSVASQAEWDTAAADPNCFAIEISSGNIVVSSNKTINSNLRINAGATLTVNEGSTLTVNMRFDGLDFESENELYGTLINNGNLILNNGLEVKGGTLENNGTLTLDGERGIGMGWYTDKDSGDTTYSALTNTGTIENYSYIGVWDENAIEIDYITFANAGIIRGSGYCFFDYAHLRFKGLSNHGNGWFEDADMGYDTSMYVQPGMYPLIFYYHHKDGDQWINTPVTVNSTGAVLTPMTAWEMSNDPTQTVNKAFYTNVEISGWDDFVLTYTDGEVTYELPVSVDLPELGFYSSTERSTDTYMEQFNYTPEASRTFYAIAELPLYWSIIDYEINDNVADLITVLRNDNIFTIELNEGVNGEISLNLSLTIQFELDTTQTMRWDRWIHITEGDYESLVVKYPDWRGDPSYPVITDYSNASFNSFINTSPGGMTAAIYYKNYDESGETWNYDPLICANLTVSEGSGIIISDWEDDPNRPEPIDDPDHTACQFLRLDFSKFGEYSIGYEVGEKTLTLPVRVGLPEAGFYNAPEASEESFISRYDYTPDARTLYYIANYDTEKCRIELESIEEGADRVNITQSETDPRLFTIVVKDGVSERFRLRLKVKMTDLIDENSYWHRTDEIEMSEGEFEALVINWPGWKDGSNGDYHFSYPVPGRDWDNNIYYATAAEMWIGGSTMAFFYRHLEGENWVYTPVDPALLTIEGDGLQICEWSDPQAGPIEDDEYSNYKFAQLDSTLCGLYNVKYTIEENTFTLPINVVLPGIAAYSAPTADESTLLQGVDFANIRTVYLIPSLDDNNAIDWDKSTASIDDNMKIGGYISLEPHYNGEVIDYVIADIIRNPFENDFRFNIALKDVNDNEIANNQIWMHSNLDDALAFDNGTLGTPAPVDVSVSVPNIPNSVQYYKFTPNVLPFMQVYRFSLSGISQGTKLFIFDSRWTLLEESNWEDLATDRDIRLASSEMTSGNEYYIAAYNRNPVNITLAASIVNVPTPPTGVAFVIQENGNAGIKVSGAVGGQQYVMYAKIHGEWREIGGVQDYDPNNSSGCTYNLFDLVDNGDTIAEYAAAIREGGVEGPQIALSSANFESVMRTDSIGDSIENLNIYNYAGEMDITGSYIFESGRNYRLHHEKDSGEWDFCTDFTGNGTSQITTGSGGNPSAGGKWVLREYSQSAVGGNYLIGWKTVVDTTTGLGSINYTQINDWLACGWFAGEGPDQHNPGSRYLHHPFHDTELNFWMVNYNSDAPGDRYTFGELLTADDLIASRGLTLTDKEGKIAVSFDGWGIYSVDYDYGPNRYTVIIEVGQGGVELYSSSNVSEETLIQEDIFNTQNEFFVIWTEGFEGNDNIDSVELSVFMPVHFEEVGSPGVVYYYRDDVSNNYAIETGAPDELKQYYIMDNARIVADTSSINSNYVKLTINNEIKFENEIRFVIKLKSADTERASIENAIRPFAYMWQSDLRELHAKVMADGLKETYYYGVSDSAQATEMTAVTALIADESRPGEFIGAFSSLICETKYYLYYSSDYDSELQTGTWTLVKGVFENTGSHNFDSEWTKDNFHHWHECDCGGQSEKAEHVWDDGIITTAATCTTAGVKTYTCLVCQGTKTEAIAALGHTWDAGVETTPATCTEAGVKTYTCSVCEDTYTESISALGHDYGSWTSKDAETHQRVCSRDANHTETQDHTWDAGVETAQAACTVAGVMTYTCSVCQGTKTEAIAALGHNYGAWQYLDETNHIHICANDPNHTETQAHTWNSGVVTPPTCTDEGYTTYTCTICGGIKVTDTVAALGHNWGDWTDDGEENHKRTCVNNQDHTETEPHTWDNGIVTTSATCNTPGVMTYTCSVCSGTKTEAIAATGHNWSAWQNLDEANHQRVCANDQTHTESEAHTWNAGVVTLAPTQTTEGVRTYTCTACQGTKTEAIPVLTHNWSNTWTFDTAYHWHACTDAGCQETNDKAAHTLNSVVTAPTCTLGGYTTVSCAICGYTSVTNPTAALGHNFVPTVIAPTCTLGGHTAHTCTRCGISYQDSATAPLGHSFGEWVVTTAPTKTSEGLRTRTCSVCHIVETEVISKLQSVTIISGTGGNGLNASVTITGNSAALELQEEEIDEIIESASESGTLTFDTSGSGTQIDDVTIPSRVITEVSSGSGGEGGSAIMKVVLSAAEVEFDSGALGSLAEETDENSTLTISAEIVDNAGLTQEQQQLVGDARVFDLTAQSTDQYGNVKTISNFNGTVTVSIPYTLSDGDDPNNIRIYYLSDSQEIEEIVCTYNAVKKCIVFTTNHFSYYLIKNDKAGVFADVSLKNWYYENVNYVLMNGLMSGTSGTLFSPERITSRAMLVTVLYRMDGEPAVSGELIFSDVEEGKWYTDAIKWASGNGIVTGFANGLFKPEEALTREQMAVILWRYAKYKGQDVSVDPAISIRGFSDAAKVSGYAQDAFVWACAHGILRGTSATTLSPQGGAQRCQLAAIIQRYIEAAVE